MATLPQCLTVFYIFVPIFDIQVIDSAIIKTTCFCFEKDTSHNLLFLRTVFPPLRLTLLENLYPANYYLVPIKTGGTTSADRLCIIHITISVNNCNSS